MDEKKYELNSDVRILELLGPNLYTNIYYVLAELIANAYDADAHNVYIISDDNKIIVEDDGKGICFCVYCYNVQPDISIDYLTGESKEEKTSEKQTEEKGEAAVRSQAEPQEDQSHCPEVSNI